MTFEERLERLKEIVEKLDSPETIELDDSLNLFEEGIGLVRTCKGLLEEAEVRIQNVTQQIPDSDVSEPIQEIENGE